MEFSPPKINLEPKEGEEKRLKKLLESSIFLFEACLDDLEKDVNDKLRESRHVLERLKKRCDGVDDD